MTTRELLAILADPGLAVIVYPTYPHPRSVWVINQQGVAARKAPVARKVFLKADLEWVATLWPAGCRIYRPRGDPRA